MKNYEEALFQGRVYYANFFRIGMKDFQVTTEFVQKLALSCTDMKRYLFDCQVRWLKPVKGPSI